MASIKEAYDSTMKEAFAGIKVFLWAIPLYIGMSGESIFSKLIGIVAAILLFGLCITLANNVVTKKPTIVPGVNFIEMLINAGLAILCSIPYALVGYLVYWGFTFIQVPSPTWNDTIHILGGLLAAAFPLSALAIFVRRKNPFEVLDFKKISYGYGEVFLDSSYFVVKLTIVSIFTIGFLIYIFYLFIGFQNSLWTYLMSAVAVFYAFLGANYLAQISEEIYTFPENEANKKREKEEIDKILTTHEEK